MQLRHCIPASNYYRYIMFMEDQIHSSLSSQEPVQSPGKWVDKPENPVYHPIKN